MHRAGLGADAINHTVTVDYEGDGVRKGNRVVSLGERPYFDASSKSRREALGLKPWVE